MARKRRILVSFEGGDSRGNMKKQKIAVSIDEESTNSDLANEIARTVGEELVALEIGDGFKLRNQDPIEMILDNDIVVARPLHSSPSDRLPTTHSDAPQTTISHQFADTSGKGYIEHSCAESTPCSGSIMIPGHIQIQFVNAELARSHAKRNLKEIIEPTNGLFAFNGEFVSGNTTLGALQQEAARVFNWSLGGQSYENIVCEHKAIGSCSCAIAQEIFRYGVFSTLHCRLSVDGERCPNEECPYSHTRLQGGTSMALPPHCSICNDALGFLCPSCLQKFEASGLESQAFMDCPIVQNAGCGHLHHSHCLGPRESWSPNVCPSGCPRANIVREAVPFDETVPHIIIVWDGDKIDKIPIPSLHYSSTGQMIRLGTRDMLSLVEDFLRRTTESTKNLSIRIHSREADSETIPFTWSTVVSVCPAASHANPDHRRFLLFASQESDLPDQPRSKPVQTFLVDFHMSDLPILVCGCTRLKDIHPLIETGSAVPLVLYVVKRNGGVTGDTANPKRSAVPMSKQSTYLLDAAWQPSISQTTRGMAALLSSLYVLSSTVSKKGICAESKVLAALYATTRFPPAVRALGLLLLNVTLQPQEKAALSEALYQASKDFSSQGPFNIANNPGRLFEAIRILLAYLVTSVNTPTAPGLTSRPLENFSLLCAVSNKRLTDPVLLNSTTIVERSVATLFAKGGVLYRHKYSSNAGVFNDVSEAGLRQLLSRTTSFSAASIYAIQIHQITTVLPPWSPSFEVVTRNYMLAIGRANETDLISRGPLELKSTVVPPQIVLDNEGLLAVFTGRGCGSMRDVNFFRPTSGGDTEVDVNDVGHALQKIIENRKSEDTWQVDSFGNVLAKSRTPDEAIVLCLDLSESMNDNSAVDVPGLLSTHQTPFNWRKESEEVVRKLLDGQSDDSTLEAAKRYFSSQHSSCHEAWSTCLDDISAEALVDHLGTMAYQEVLYTTLKTVASKKSHIGDDLFILACFAMASTNQADDLVEFVEDFLNGLDSDDEDVCLGSIPYDVPKYLLDPITGDLLIQPIEAADAIGTTIIVNRSSELSNPTDLWPTGIRPSSFSYNLSDFQAAVHKWTIGDDILRILDKKPCAEPDSPTLKIELHHEGQVSEWHLPKTTSISVLYQLTNRVTYAKYSPFCLRIISSKAVIPFSNSTLGSTALKFGGQIEVCWEVPHSRGLQQINVSFCGYDDIQKIMIPRDAPAFALFGYIRQPDGDLLSDLMLWYGLTDSGDDHRRGNIVQPHQRISSFTKTTSNVVSLECDVWFWSPVGSQKLREESRNLTRLQLLKELFNVFLNRASAFDTSISLVLGLVTFADEAYVKQELTPVFENFRQELDKVEATGDTAVYDALDMARSCLVNFRPDLPNLRRRIIIVSDGQDTSSEVTADVVCSVLQRDRIMVDSVQVGHIHNSILHALSVATGGYRFFPKTSLGDALSIFDLETMLSSAERPQWLAASQDFSPGRLYKYSDTSLYPIDIVTIDKFPQRAEHPKLRKPVQDVRRSMDVGHSTNGRLKRIMKELRAFAADPHPQIDVYANDEDISFLKVIIEAPDDIESCPYKGGCFLLTCDLPEEYPRDPPEIRFVTFILHPNVSKQGKVCVAELGRLWSSDITLKELLSLVYGLLLEPDLDNPLEIQASLKYYDDDGTYALAASNAVKEQASKSRAQWRSELSD